SFLSEAGTASTRRNRPGAVGPAGVGEQGRGTRGVPGNLGGPIVSTAMGRLGNRLINSPVPPAERRGRWARRTTRAVVSPSEGHEARREGRSGVGAPHTIDEVGEQALLDPTEKRGRRVVGSTSGNTRGPRTSSVCHRQGVEAD